MIETPSERYDRFIKGALGAGFTDDQVDFLEEWFDSLHGEVEKIKDVLTRVPTA